jgi:sugar lactone lactonase YvrE
MSEDLAGDFETIARGTYLEGLAVDPARARVWYSDVIAGGVHGIERDEVRWSLNAGRMWTGGIALNEDGAVLSTGAGGIMWNRPDTGESGWLLREIDAVPINGINELAADPEGGLYFGTVDIEHIAEGKTPRPATIYHLTRNGEVTLLAEGLGFVNGMALSADGSRLYYNETFDGVYAFQVRSDGSLSDRARLLGKEDCDGMALDADGTLWVSGFRSSSITRLTVGGSQAEPFSTPAGAITQIRFGGPDLGKLYLTSVPADGGDSLKAGIAPAGAASNLYRARSPVTGLPIRPARFRLT